MSQDGTKQLFFDWCPVGLKMFAKFGSEYSDVDDELLTTNRFNKNMITNNFYTNCLYWMQIKYFKDPKMKRLK